MEICQTLQSRVAASSPRLDSRAADSIKVKGRRLPPLTGEWREGNGALIDCAPGVIAILFNRQGVQPHSLPAHMLVRYNGKLLYRGCRGS